MAYEYEMEQTMSNYFGQNGSFRARRQREEVDPMASMSNIGDVMLVFACGLMAALITAWSVDLAEFQKVEISEEFDAEKTTEINEDLFGEGESFVDKGHLYQDPATGKWYLKKEEESQ